MVRPIAIIHVGESFSLIPLATGIGLFVSASLLVALCAKHASKFPRKPNTPKSPLLSPKQLITAISHKAINNMRPLIHKKSAAEESKGEHHEESSGVWQKAILMGDKCRPPEFSGVIYYDYAGNRVPEMPKSPRAAAAPAPFRDFTFPMETDKSIY